MAFTRANTAEAANNGDEDGGVVLPAVPPSRGRGQTGRRAGGRGRGRGRGRGGAARGNKSTSGAKRPLSASPPPQDRKRGRTTATLTVEEEPNAHKSESESQRHNANALENHDVSNEVEPRGADVSDSAAGLQQSDMSIVMMPTRSTALQRANAFATAQARHAARRAEVSPQPQGLPGPGDDDDDDNADEERNSEEEHEDTSRERLQRERSSQEQESIHQQRESDSLVPVGAGTPIPELSIEDMDPQEAVVAEHGPDRVANWVDNQRTKFAAELKSEAARVRAWGNFVVRQERKLDEIDEKLRRLGPL